MSQTNPRPVTTPSIPAEARALLDGCFEQYRAKLTDIGRASIEMSGDLFDGNSFVEEKDVDEVRAKRGAWVERFAGAELRQNGEIGHDDGLPRKVAMYATGCMLLYLVGPRGLLHDARLAVAGFLLQLGLSEEEAILIGQSVAEVTGNDVADVAAAVHSTAQKLRRGERVNGRGALIKIIGDEGKKVVSRISEWFGGTVFILAGTIIR